MAPFPFPAHQTGRADFPHPAFRLGSLQSPRRRLSMQASELADAEVSEDLRSGESARAAVAHLAPFGEEASRVIADVVIDSLISQRERTVAEVSFPTRQEPVQALAYVRPCSLFARLQDIAHLR